MLKLGNPLSHLAALPDRLRALPGMAGAWLRERWRRRSPEHLANVVSAAAAAVAVVWFIALLLAHLKVVTQPGPQEFNEPAIWHTTWLLDHGRNPYTIGELPGSAYCFGPLYNYVVIALSPLLGIDYPAHRMVVLIFLLATLWVLMRAMQRAGAGLGIALLSVVFYYWMSLGNIEITARPDTLGLLFFVLGILVPWERGYTTGSTLTGLLCAVLAYNFKSYLAVAGCATLLGHFIVRNRWQACWLGVLFFALIGLSFGLSCHFFPYFYIETVIVQQGGAAVNSRDDISLMHTIMLFERGWPYFALMALGVAMWLVRKMRARRAARAAAQKPAPASTDERRFLALGTVFMIFLAVVYFYMGHNAGAFFTYHLHLLFPLMFILAAYAIRPVWLRIVSGLVLIGFFLAWVEVPPVPDSVAPYRRLEKLVWDTHSEVLGIACVTDIFERNGRHVLHNGNTMFMGFAFANDRALHDPAVGALAKKFEETDGEVRAKIESRAYGLVLTEFDEPYFSTSELLKQYYDKVEQIDYYTYFGHSPIRVWRPKPVLRPTVTTEPAGSAGSGK